MEQAYSRTPPIQLPRRSSCSITSTRFLFGKHHCTLMVLYNRWSMSNKELQVFIIHFLEQKGSRSFFKGSRTGLSYINRDGFKLGGLWLCLHWRNMYPWVNSSQVSLPRVRAATLRNETQAAQSNWITVQRNCISNGWVRPKLWFSTYSWCAS